MARVTPGIRLRTAVQESADPQQIYAAALVRLAIRMKRMEPTTRPDWERLVDQALGRTAGLEVNRRAFRGYLERNYSFLLASVGQKHS
jgi:hypothetical protein